MQKINIFFIFNLCSYLAWLPSHFDYFNNCIYVDGCI